MKKSWVLSVCVLILLGGCGSDTGNGNGIVFLPAGSSNLGEARVLVPVEQNYTALTAMSAGRSRLEGIGTYAVSFSSTQIGAESSRMYLVGYIDHDTGEVSVTDTLVTMTDSDGDGFPGSSIYYVGEPGPNGEQQSLWFDDGVFFNATNYQYARLFNWTVSDGAGGSEIARVVAGVTTDPGDISRSATASYTGNVLTEFERDTVVSFLRGSASVQADFGAGTVDAQLMPDNLSAFEGGGTTIQVEGMDIIENGFVGGTVTILDGSGADVTAAVVGANAEHEAGGMFFGPAPGEIPAEVGGFATVRGDDRAAYSYFLAD
ncbi:MAG: hypothetical protein AAGM21_05815 [Pseudomonadota bacterium]